MSMNPLTQLAQTPSAACDTAIERYALLGHPFYQAWSDGTLPVDALRDYAREYGAFIRLVGDGWATAGEPTIAKVEEGHANVWERTFAAGLGTAVSAPQIAETAQLVATAGDLFGERATALGALYAFEAQQPYTAQSKLQGLETHYDLPAKTEAYFELHQDDFAEPALLAEAMNALDSADAARAVAACETMSRALYDALTGIHAPYVGAGC